MTVTIFHYWIISASTLALLVGVGSLLVAFKVMRVNTTHSVSLVSISHSYRHSVCDGKSMRLLIQLKCLGLPIREPEVLLQSHNPDGWGSAADVLERCNSTGDILAVHSRELHRGDIAHYVLVYPAEFDDNQLQFARRFWDSFENTKKHKTKLLVMQDGVQLECIGPRWFDFLIEKWNWFAIKLETKTMKSVTTPGGGPGIVNRISLPKSRKLFNWEVVNFAKMVQHATTEHEPISGSDN